MNVTRNKRQQGRAHFVQQRHDCGRDIAPIRDRAVVLIPLIVLPGLFAGVHAFSQLLLGGGVALVFLCWLINRICVRMEPNYTRFKRVVVTTDFIRG